VKYIVLGRQEIILFGHLIQHHMLMTLNLARINLNPQTDPKCECHMRCGRIDRATKSKKKDQTSPSTMEDGLN